MESGSLAIRAFRREARLAQRAANRLQFAKNQGGPLNSQVHRFIPPLQGPLRTSALVRRDAFPHHGMQEIGNTVAAIEGGTEGGH